MENRLLYFVSGGVHSAILTLDNYPPVYSVLSTTHTIENDYSAVESRLSELAIDTESRNLPDITKKLSNVTELLVQQESLLQKQAVETLLSLPGVKNLSTQGNDEEWKVLVQTTEPLTAYGYVVRAGNIHEVPLVDVSSIGCKQLSQAVEFTVSDQDYIAITVETLTQMFVAVAPHRK